MKRTCCVCVTHAALPTGICSPGQQTFTHPATATAACSAAAAYVHVRVCCWSSRLSVCLSNAQQVNKSRRGPQGHSSKFRGVTKHRCVGEVWDVEDSQTVQTAAWRLCQRQLQRLLVTLAAHASLWHVCMNGSAEKSVWFDGRCCACAVCWWLQEDAALGGACGAEWRLGCGLAPATHLLPVPARLLFPSTDCGAVSQAPGANCYVLQTPHNPPCTHTHNRPTSGTARSRSTWVALMTRWLRPRHTTSWPSR